MTKQERQLRKQIEELEQDTTIAEDEKRTEIEALERDIQEIYDIEESGSVNSNPLNRW